MKRITKYKRLKITLIILAVNYLFFAAGIFFDIDLVSIGTGLSLLNAPLYAFIIGDTIRKSEKDDKIKKQNDQLG